MLHDILLVLLGLVVGAVAGFFIARKVMEKYLKKNPPINEDMIKVRTWNELYELVNNGSY